MVQIYDCKKCDKRRKKLLGCVRPFKKKNVWKIDECIFCEGQNKKCRYCKGRGDIFVRRCPRAVAKNDHLLPYFLEYKRSNYIAWPDGKGRYYQPVKLIQAFDIFSYYFNKFESKQLEEIKGKG